MKKTTKNSNQLMKIQKIKGVFILPMFLVGLITCFFNLIIGSIIALMAIALYLYYKNNAENQSSIYYNLGVKQFAQRDKVVAKNFFTKSVELNRQNYDAFLALAIISYDDKDYGRALLNFRNAKVERLNIEMLQYIMSDCYYNMNNLKKGKELLEGINLENTHVENLKNNLLGKIYFKEEKYEDALKVFENVKSDYFDKTEKMRYKYYKGLSYLKVGNEEMGKPIIEELIEIDRYFRDVEIYGKQLNII